jgi:hypothetical protein
MKKNPLTILMVCAVLLWPASGFAASPPGNRVVREYYDNGRLRLYMKVRDKKIVRKKAYYRNGKLLADYAYKDGQPVRLAHYYENGRLYSIWTRKSGVTKYYERDGRLKVVVDLDPNRLNPNIPSSYIFPRR